MINTFPLARYSYCATDSMVQQNFTKMEFISVTSCLVCCFNCCEMKLYLIVLTDDSTCGNSSLANSLGRASSTPSCAWHHSSAQPSIVVCCLHASCSQFTAVQQQKMGSKSSINQLKYLKCVFANGYCCYPGNKLDTSSNRMLFRNPQGP